MRRLAVLARAPGSGGKSRLTAGMTAERALALREALLLDTLTAAAGAGVPVTVFVTPPQAMDEVAALAGASVRVQPQSTGDIGARMHAAFTALFADGASQVVLIGSDLPTLPPAHITAAFDALARGTDVVLGPADDGGYYLIGLPRPTAEVFADIAWGGGAVLAQTCDAARRAGLTVALVPNWYDVDDAGGLARVRSDEAPAVWTRAWLAVEAWGLEA